MALELQDERPGWSFFAGFAAATFVIWVLGVLLYRLTSGETVGWLWWLPFIVVLGVRFELFQLTSSLALWTLGGKKDLEPVTSYRGMFRFGVAAGVVDLVIMVAVMVALAYLDPDDAIPMEDVTRVLVVVLVAVSVVPMVVEVVLLRWAVKRGILTRKFLAAV